MGWSDWIKAHEDARQAVVESLPKAWERLEGDEDRYTCVPPLGHEVDPAIVAALHEQDPGAIILWRIQRWMAPGHPRPVLHVHVGIGRYNPVARFVRRAFYVLMPQRPTHPAPNVLDHFFEGDQVGLGGPLETLPFDWAAFAYCRRRWEKERLTTDRFDRLVRIRHEREAKMRAAHQAELEYVKSWIEPWILKRLEEKASDGDWDEYLRLMAHGVKRARASGAWNPSRDRRRMSINLGSRTPL